MNEKWRDIAGWPYQVSSLGRVRRSVPAQGGTAGRILRTYTVSGYAAIKLQHNGIGSRKSFYVHRLVAAAFLGPRPKGMEVNHKDGVKTRNIYSNLEYVTSSENKQHAIRHGLFGMGDGKRGRKLTDPDVKEIRNLFALGTHVIRREDIAARFKVSSSYVYEIGKLVARQYVSVEKS